MTLFSAASDDQSPLLRPREERLVAFAHQLARELSAERERHATTSRSLRKSVKNEVRRPLFAQLTSLPTHLHPPGAADRTHPTSLPSAMQAELQRELTSLRAEWRKRKASWQSAHAKHLLMKSKHRKLVEDVRSAARRTASDSRRPHHKLSQRATSGTTLSPVVPSEVAVAREDGCVPMTPVPVATPGGPWWTPEPPAPPPPPTRSAVAPPCDGPTRRARKESGRPCGDCARFLSATGVSVTCTHLTPVGMLHDRASPANPLRQQPCTPDSFWSMSFGDGDGDDAGDPMPTVGHPTHLIAVEEESLVAYARGGRHQHYSSSAPGRAGLTPKIGGLFI
jgi:predicted nucleic acid-binding Zn ribbon protein